MMTDAGWWHEHMVFDVGLTHMQRGHKPDWHELGLQH